MQAHWRILFKIQETWEESTKKMMLHLKYHVEELGLQHLKNKRFSINKDMNSFLHFKRVQSSTHKV